MTDMHAVPQLSVEGLPTGLNLASYDRILVAFSGGKDSLACFLRLIELGVPLDQIELHHHDIDGNGPAFMDWTITHGYWLRVAQVLRNKALE